jgi:hypothetical protein
LNVADAGSRRVRLVTFVGLIQPAPMQETEAFREGEGVKASLIQVLLRDRGSVIEAGNDTGRP